MNQKRIVVDNDNVPEWCNWYNSCGENQGNAFLNTYDWIVNKDGEVNEDQGDGNTSLFYACRDGFNEEIKFLLKHGADIEHKNCVGMTPIFYVGNEIDTPDTLQLMIDSGADINVVDNDGDNLLSQIERLESPLCIQLLMKTQTELEKKQLLDGVDVGGLRELDDKRM